MAAYNMILEEGAEVWLVEGALHNLVCEYAVI